MVVAVPKATPFDVLSITSWQLQQELGEARDLIALSRDTILDQQKLLRQRGRTIHRLERKIAKRNRKNARQHARIREVNEDNYMLYKDFYEENARANRLAFTLRNIESELVDAWEDSRTSIPARDLWSLFGMISPEDLEENQIVVLDNDE